MFPLRHRTLHRLWCGSARMMMCRMQGSSICINTISRAFYLRFREARAETMGAVDRAQAPVWQVAAEKGEEVD